MAEADWPLRDEARSAANGSAGALAPQELKQDGLESLRLLDHVDSPRLTLHDFHKLQQSPAKGPSPELEHRRVRRKASTADLTLPAPTRYTDPAACWSDDTAWTPSLVLPRAPHTTAYSHFSPSPLHCPPLPPRPRTYTASPSLSSTVDTIQSSPFQTPVNHRRSRVEHEDAYRRRDFAEHIRTKRKFDSLKRAKRLPRTSDSSSTGLGELWEVYAAVYSLEDDVQEVGERVKLREGKSVRFQADTGQEASVSPPSAEELRDKRGGHPTSSVSLSRLDWPLPPSHDNWQGAFGHLDTVTPPLTPATILYRGASFNVWNPHASLVLASPNLETPGEFDGLLDSYFETHDSPTPDIMPNNTADREPSPTTSHVPSESSRRILYEDAETAHRNILRTRGHDASQATARPSGLLTISSSQRPYSDPFDLTLSENSSRSTLPTVEHLRKGVRRDEATRMQPLGLGITDSDDTHATSGQTTNATLKHIIDGYDYTRDLPSSLGDQEFATSPDIERGRFDPAQQQTHDSSHGLLSPLQTPESEYQRTACSLNKHPYGSVPLPTPPQPTYNGIRKPALHYADSSDLPSTDQSYGNTNNLLNITPDAHVQRPLDSGTCVKPAHIHAYQHSDQDAPVRPFVENFEHDNKENIPPYDYQTPSHASPGMHGDQHRGYSDPDYDDYGDLGRAMPRSSSYYPEDGQSAWITEADPSQTNLGGIQRFSAMSAESYTNTSLAESQNRFSFQAPTTQPPLPPVVNTLPATSAMSALGAMKATGSIKNIAHRRHRLIEERISVLQSKIAAEQVASGYTGSPKIDGAQRRADLNELNHLRSVLPGSSRPCVSKANELAETVQVNPPAKLHKPKAYSGPQYHPRINFSRALGQHNSAFNSGSDTRGLLASPLTPSPYTNLGYSESTGTFMTVQQESPLNVRGAATSLWSPISNNPTNRAILAKSPKGQKPVVLDVGMELGPMTGRSNRSQRAAIGSQYENRDLQLVKNNKRLTDAQLVDRSAGWTTMPSRRHMRGHYAISSTSTNPMLGRPEARMDHAARMEQKRVSKRYAYPCYAFPPLALAFGFGAFDKSIERVTGGRVKEACPKEKRWALWAGFPLGMMLWVIFAIVVYLMITLVKPSKENGSPIS